MKTKHDEYREEYLRIETEAKEWRMSWESAMARAALLSIAYGEWCATRKLEEEVHALMTRAYGGGK